MHDPYTLAFSLKLPLSKRFSRSGFGITLIDVWHVDPERGGDDNSCGWHAPHLTDDHRAIINDMVDWDMRNPFFSSESIDDSAVIVDPRYRYKQMALGDSWALCTEAWEQFMWRVHRRRWLNRYDVQEIHHLAFNPIDNLRACLVNRDQGTKEERVRHFLGCVLRAYLRVYRPWYRHPRWHVHHWKINVIPLQNMKRWLWTRCAHCGQRFGWRESVISSQWDSDGPQWFRSERHVYHSGCYRQHTPTTVPAGPHRTRSDGTPAGDDAEEKG